MVQDLDCAHTNPLSSADSPPQPFLLFLATRGAHPPYGAPKEFHHKFSPQAVQAKIKLQPPNPKNKPEYMSVTSGIPAYRNLTTLPDNFFYQIEAVYLGMVSYTGASKEPRQ